MNPKFTKRIKDMPENQSDGLLRLLYEHMTNPSFVVRYHWEPGTLAFWDNRSTMHFGIYDYEGERRVMHRVTLRGDPPVGPSGGCRGAIDIHRREKKRPGQPSGGSTSNTDEGP